MEHPFAITLDAGTSLANHTGSWRTSRPVYVDRFRPAIMPARQARTSRVGSSHAEAGDYEAAWRVLTQDNPLPAVMGRVCYHPCETACNRAQIDAAVGINSVERFPRRRGDQARLAVRPAGRRKRQARARGRRRASGLSAAYHLRRLGHEVEIFEAGPIAGGMMRFGIPKYRLPRDVLDAEIARILDLGVDPQAQRQGREYPRGHDDARLRRGVSRGRRSYRQARLHSGRRGREDPRRRPGAALDGGRGQAAARAAASSSTAAATPRSTSPAPPSASARPRRSSSIAAPAIACPRTISSSRRRSRKA